jgi:hypothetical protein
MRRILKTNHEQSPLISKGKDGLAFILTLLAYTLTTVLTILLLMVTVFTFLTVLPIALILRKLNRLKLKQQLMDLLQSIKLLKDELLVLVRPRTK